MGIRSRRNLKRKEASALEAAGGSSHKRKHAIISAPESDEDKIRRVKSEEGKILKLKKAAMAANEEMSEATRAELAPYMPTSTVNNPAEEPEPAAAGKKRTKKVLVKTVVTQAEIDHLQAMPCPFAANEMSEDELALYPQRFQDSYHEEMNIAKKLRDYHQGLIDQYAVYGFAVDESEAEVTDDEEDDEKRTS